MTKIDAMNSINGDDFDGTMNSYIVYCFETENVMIM